MIVAVRGIAQRPARGALEKAIVAVLALAATLLLGAANGLDENVVPYAKCDMPTVKVDCDAHGDIMMMLGPPSMLSMLLFYAIYQ